MEIFKSFYSTPPTIKIIVESSNHKPFKYPDKNNKLIKGMGASSIASALFGRDYGNYVDLPESSEFSAEGDYAHKQLEYLNSLKKYLLGLDGFSEEEI